MGYYEPSAGKKFFLSDRRYFTLQGLETVVGVGGMAAVMELVGAYTISLDQAGNVQGMSQAPGDFL